MINTTFPCGCVIYVTNVNANEICEVYVCHMHETLVNQQLPIEDQVNLLIELQYDISCYTMD